MCRCKKSKALFQGREIKREVTIDEHGSKHYRIVVDAKLRVQKLNAREKKNG